MPSETSGGTPTGTVRGEHDGADVDRLVVELGALKQAVAGLLFRGSDGTVIIHPDDVDADLVETLEPTLQRLLGVAGLAAAREQLVGDAVAFIVTTNPAPAEPWEEE